MLACALEMMRTRENGRVVKMGAVRRGQILMLADGTLLSGAANSTEEPQQAEAAGQLSRWRLDSPA